MHGVFPAVTKVSIYGAEAGSVVRLPRSDAPFYAIVTDHFAKNGRRSLVTLNATFPRRPSVFVSDWDDEEPCLSYGSNLHFELGNADEDLDVRGRRWGDAPGVIVFFNDVLYLRAAPADDFWGNVRYINIKTGTMLSDHIPSNTWTFGAWKLWMKDGTLDQKQTLVEYDVRKLSVGT